jgi:hypothetical protein
MEMLLLEICFYQLPTRITPTQLFRSYKPALIAFYVHNSGKANKIITKVICYSSSLSILYTYIHAQNWSLHFKCTILVFTYRYILRIIICYIFVTTIIAVLPTGTIATVHVNVCPPLGTFKIKQLNPHVASLFHCDPMLYTSHVSLLGMNIFVKNNSLRYTLMICLTLSYFHRLH